VNGVYLHAPADADIPLNWSISKRTAERIWQGTQARDNADELVRLRSAFDVSARGR